MKLKIRADAKDFAIFGIFCIILFYVCSIAVLNLSEFSKYGTLVGFDPMPVFSSAVYLVPTLVIFIGALAAIIMSVSSYFFEFSKGIGLSTAAGNEKGYSRWATEKEMKKELKEVDALAEQSPVAGVPIISNGKKIWVDDGEYHNLIIGSTGSGKTEMTIQPMVKILAKKGESMIITDPKGEIYEKNAVELKEKGYNIVLLNFRNPQNGNCWNPLNLPYQLYINNEQDKSCELLEDLGMNILYDDNNKAQDPFWEKTSADYFTGLALSLFEDAKAEEINLNSINLMTTAGEDKVGGTTYVKEYFSYKNQASAAYINAASTLMAPNETKSSILAVFKQKIKLFSSRENLSEMLSRSDFDMNDIGRKKTAVFIVIQDEKKTYHSLVTIFLKQCYETLISVAQECGGQLPYRTNFILDEFANMPPLKDVTTMITAARSRHIRFTLVIQNFAQLYQVYGKENGETIKGNCGNIIYLISSELAALEEISKLCGEVKSKEKDKTSSTPLITVSDLQRLPQWTIVVIRIRMMPFKTKLTPNFEMVKNNNWGKNYELATYPARERGIVQTFDIKEFVDKKKEEKVNDMLNSITGSSTKPIDPGFNPFNNQRNGDRQVGMPDMSRGLPSGFDVDEMVKRIDAKIAELEEEERQEKAKMDKENEANNQAPSTADISVPDIEMVPKDNIEEPVVLNIPKIENVSLIADDNKDLEVPDNINTTPLNDMSSDDEGDDTSNGGLFGFPDIKLVPKEESNISEMGKINNVEDVKEAPAFADQSFDYNQGVDEIAKKAIAPTLEDVDIPNMPKFINDISKADEHDFEDVNQPSDLKVDEIVKDDASNIIGDNKQVIEIAEIPSMGEPISTTVQEQQQNNDIEISKDNNIQEKSKDQIEVKPSIELKSKVINNNYITDDQFFDDFFSEE